MSFLSFTLIAAAAAGLIFLASSADAEQVQNFRMCRNSKCEIFDLFIDPCPEALLGNPCEIPQGINATITYKYIPKFSSEVPQTRLYAETLLIDLPFMDMDTNACLYTDCPIQLDVEQNWNYTLFVSDSYPRNSYTVKSKLWDNGPDAKISDVCCFKFDMIIV